MNVNQLEIRADMRLIKKVSLPTNNVPLSGVACRFSPMVYNPQNMYTMTAINFTAMCNVVFAYFLVSGKTWRERENGDKNEMGVRGKHKYEGTMKGREMNFTNQKKGVRRIKGGREGW